MTIETGVLTGMCSYHFRLKSETHIHLISHNSIHFYSNSGSVLSPHSYSLYILYRSSVCTGQVLLNNVACGTE
jgi:hypothetical protein